MSKKMNILCVDDDMINLKLLTRMLNKYEDIGEIYTAYNGVEARLKVREHDDIDLILLDIMMPIMTGEESTTSILGWEKENNIKHIPIIAVTANAIKGDRERFLDAGMDEYITKPLKKQAVEHIFKKFFGEEIYDKYLI